MNWKHKKYRIFFIISLTLFIALLFFWFKSTHDAETSEARLSKHRYNGVISYPQVFGIKKSAAIKINAALEKAAQNSYKNYLNLMKAGKSVNKTDKKFKYAYNTSYRFMYNRKGKLSIIYHDYLYTGGAGALYVTAFNFDLSTGEQYEIKDIIKTSYKKVQKYAFDYLSTHEPYAKSVTKLSDVPVNKDTQFVFYDDSIFLVFQDDVIESYPDGNPFIKIPKSVYE